MNKESKILIHGPEQIFQKIMDWFDTRRKIAFFTTFIVCVIVHFTLYSKELTNADGITNLVYYFDSEWEISLGRWGLLFVDSLRNFLVIPIITTIISFVLMSFSSIILSDLLEIREKSLIALLSICLAVSPVFSYTLSYYYCSDGYSLAMLLSILSVYFMYKKKHTFWSIPLTIATLSLYQSYINVTITLIIFIPILHILKNIENTKNIVQKLFKNLLLLLLSIIMYFILVKAISYIFNVPLTGYKGVDHAGFKNTLQYIITSLKKSYSSFYQFYFRNDIYNNTFFKRNYLYCFTFILIFIIILFNIIINKIYKDKIKILLLVLLLLIFPLATSFIQLIATDTYMILLMSASMILLLPFTLSLLQTLNIYHNLSILLKWLGIIFCCVISYTYILSTNSFYIAMQTTYNQTYATTLRIIDRIETHPDYNEDMPILILGIVDNNNFPRKSPYGNYSIYEVDSGYLEFDILFDDYYELQQTWRNYIYQFFGLNFNFCFDIDTYVSIANSNEFKEMDTFPMQDSIQIINDVLVIKLTDTPKLP